jgi:hypothetical protein
LKSEYQQELHNVSAKSAIEVDLASKPKSTRRNSGCTSANTVESLEFLQPPYKVEGMFSKWVLIAFIATYGVLKTNARNVLEVESQYLGDGSFQYSSRTLDDPFFTKFDLVQLGLTSFTNLVQITPPPHWTNTFNPEWSSIGFAGTISQPRINAVTLQAKSAETHFRTMTNAWFIAGDIQLAPSYSGNIIAFIRLDCLVPCSAEESDGSAPSLISRYEAIKDVKIDAVVRTNGEVYGVTYSWNEPSTVDLEGSHDMTNWNFIARFFGDPPRTTWTTNISLNSFGEFFRLALVSNHHVTNSHSARASAPVVSSSTVRVQSYRIVAGRLEADFASVTNSVYEVEMCGTDGEKIETHQIVAKNFRTTASFDAESCPKAGYIRVEQLSP